MRGVAALSLAMVARFGVQRCVSSLEAGACAAALVLGVAACSGNTLVVGEELPPPASGSDPAESSSGITPIVPPPEGASLSACPPSPAERQALDGCWPTRHLGTWRGFFTGIPRYPTSDGAGAEFPSGELSLVLGETGQAQLTFGVPPPGVPASDPPISLCAPRDGAAACPALGRVITGFAYEPGQLELFDPELAPERIAGEPPLELPESLEFVVRLSEPWDTWCFAQGPERELGCSAGDCSPGEWLPGAAIDSPGVARSDSRGCRCDGSGCRADVQAASLSISLQMSADGKALRGSYAANGAASRGAGLEFRKAEP